MSKLSIAPKPTFKAVVNIPGVGGGLAAEFEFKWRKASENQALFDRSAAGEIDDTEVVLALVESWDFEEPLNRESVEMLLEYYPQAPAGIMNAYVGELKGAREKN